MLRWHGVSCDSSDSVVDIVHHCLMTPGQVLLVQELHCVSLSDIKIISVVSSRFRREVKQIIKVDSSKIHVLTHNLDDLSWQWTMSLDNCCKQLKPSVSSSVSLWISGECWETCVFSLLWLYCVSHRLLRSPVTPVTPVQLWAHWDCDQAGAVITLSVPRSRHCQQQLHTAWSRLHSRHFSTHFHAGGKNICKPSLHQEIKKKFISYLISYLDEVSDITCWNTILISVELC